MTQRLGVILLGLALVATGCSTDDGASDPDGLLVVATTSILGDMAAAVVGGHGVVEVVIPIGADAHDFTPSSRQAARIQEADLVLAVGLGLEEALTSVLGGAAEGGTRVLWLAPLLDPRSFDDDGPGSTDLDPHVWLDPRRMATAARLVADTLRSIAPEVDWAEGAEGYAEAMLAADAEIRSLVSPIPESRRLLVTNHDALGYFADRYGFTVVGAVIPGGSTLVAPSAAALAALVELVEELEIPAIFAETTDSTALAEALAAETGHPVAVVELFTESLGPPGSGAETLAEMLVTNARLIVTALHPEGAAP